MMERGDAGGQQLPAAQQLRQWTTVAVGIGLSLYVLIEVNFRCCRRSADWRCSARPGWCWPF